MTDVATSREENLKNGKKQNRKAAEIEEGKGGPLWAAFKRKKKPPHAVKPGEKGASKLHAVNKKVVRRAYQYFPKQF